MSKHQHNDDKNIAPNGTFFIDVGIPAEEVVALVNTRLAKPGNSILGLDLAVIKGFATAVTSEGANVADVVNAAANLMKKHHWGTNPHNTLTLLFHVIHTHTGEKVFRQAAFRINQIPAYAVMRL